MGRMAMVTLLAALQGSCVTPLRADPPVGPLVDPCRSLPQMVDQDSLYGTTVPDECVGRFLGHYMLVVKNTHLVYARLGPSGFVSVYDDMQHASSARDILENWHTERLQKKWEEELPERLEYIDERMRELLQGSVSEETLDEMLDIVRQGIIDKHQRSKQDYQLEVIKITPRSISLYGLE